jgi:S-adenosylmethionine hydrolase
MKIPRRLRPRRVALLSDFGVGPYIGQIQLLLAAKPCLPVVNLVSDLVPFRPDLAAYLLPALLRGMPARTLYLCVVDPGVGSSRGVVAAHAGGDWFLAPDNGSLVPLLRDRSDDAQVWCLEWRPREMSATFHGRDLFTPLAQRISGGVLPSATPMSSLDLVGADQPQQLAAVCYIDHYGNLVSGMRASDVAPERALRAGNARIARSTTFSDVPVGSAFWYENAFGLLEIAVNQGRADNLLGLRPGDPLIFTT